MSAIAVPGITGRIDADEWSTLKRYWLDDDLTGHEYGLAWELAVTVNHFWGGRQEQRDPPDDPPPPPTEGSFRERAALLADATPHVAGTPRRQPRLSGNLAEDVHEVCGLTWRQIADVFGISERAVASWRSQSVPRHRIATMEALRAIGAMLVGGLGPDGVCKWFTAGEPSRLRRIRDGEQEDIVEEANAYGDTPAT